MDLNNLLQDFISSLVSYLDQLEVDYDIKITEIQKDDVNYHAIIEFLSNELISIIDSDHFERILIKYIRGFCLCIFYPGFI